MSIGIRKFSSRRAGELKGHEVVNGPGSWTLLVFLFGFLLSCISYVTVVNQWHSVGPRGAGAFLTCGRHVIDVADRRAAPDRARQKPVKPRAFREFSDQYECSQRWSEL